MIDSVDIHSSQSVNKWKILNEAFWKKMGGSGGEKRQRKRDSSLNSRKGRGAEEMKEGGGGSQESEEKTKSLSMWKRQFCLRKENWKGEIR
ncbi:hypothetical protein CEXT_507841 [Caerostris extrusa]|uniref:Uncharacterized protein n=1 Tax=Caerostris extrusa TaxID=172846 RepID=A0AAV4XC38_CAEEX|nr:hypothetical protein CEXT_507841 [Caerostris extrusa]